MSKADILVIEDDEDILELVRFNLAREGFRVAAATDGARGLRLALARVPDLVLLDLMLPGMEGLEVCRRLRREPSTRRVPIVMVTARGEDADIVAGLQAGADDYVTKPFGNKVLVARVEAALRRARDGLPAEDAVVRVHRLVIHPGRHEALLDGKPLALTHTEFRLLHVLARRPGWVMTREQIVDAVHGEDYPVTDRAVDVQVVGLRRKLGASSDYIETVRGVGYRLRE